MSKKNKKKKNNKANTVLIIILLCILGVCLYKLIPYFMDIYSAEKTYDDLNEEANEDAEDWRDFIIDWDYLHSINEEIVAWIRFDNLDVIPINYPILYAPEETNKYLYLDIYGNYSASGSIFLEETNNPDFNDPSSIVYGHNMKAGTMFGSLKKYRRDSSIYEENKYFTIYTPENAYRYEIFSYFVTEEGSFVYVTGYSHNSVFEEYVNKLEASSMVTTDINVTGNDDIVILSTCTSRTDDERFVVIGCKVDGISYEDEDWQYVRE